MTTKKKNEQNQKNFSIKVCKNGPYLVCGGIPLTQKIIRYNKKYDSCEWEDGTTFLVQTSYSLCRCGQSHNKPFCDGTHTKVNFDGTETASLKTYYKNTVLLDGPTLTLTDAKDLCASARFCHRAGGIWNLILTSNRPTDKTIAIEEAADCPSGRLVISEKNTGKILEPKLDPSIVLIEDPFIGVSGPIWVRGNILIESANGLRYAKRNRITLCRCGKSQNKPFCDSSHYPE
jgi:CDGSH-type Zn-finger protein